LRSHLAALDLSETKGYIERRLKLAGSPNPAVLFPQETIVSIFRHTRGFPRLINTVCENALIAAYARQSPSVTPEIIDGIAADFRLGVQTRRIEPEPKNNNEDLDLRKAAKSLLELYAHLQHEQARDEDVTARVRVRVPEHEPYI
jgi:general secretion pathway protein A